MSSVLRRAEHGTARTEVDLTSTWAGRRLIDVEHPDLAIVQDIAVQAGQGRIADREHERLGRSDTAIILWRKILARELRAIAEGRASKKWRVAPVDVIPTLGF